MHIQIQRTWERKNVQNIPSDWLVHKLCKSGYFNPKPTDSRLYKFPAGLSITNDTQAGSYGAGRSERERQCREQGLEGRKGIQSCTYVSQYTLCPVQIPLWWSERCTQSSPPPCNSVHAVSPPGPTRPQWSICQCSTWPGAPCNRAHASALPGPAHPALEHMPVLHTAWPALQRAYANAPPGLTCPAMEHTSMPLQLRQQCDQPFTWPGPPCDSGYIYPCHANRWRWQSNESLSPSGAAIATGISSQMPYFWDNLIHTVLWASPVVLWYLGFFSFEFHFKAQKGRFSTKEQKTWIRQSKVFHPELFFADFLHLMN
jgi:hypothetical protein